MDRPYKRVACCIDRDDMADLVVREGSRLAGEGIGVLEIVHVIAPPHAIGASPFSYFVPIMEVRSEAEAWLADVVRAAPGAIPVLLDGSPARELCAWAQASGVDLIVAAADRGLMERAILGSFASYVAYHASCSVLLVHRPVEPVGATAAAHGAAEHPGK